MAVKKLLRLRVNKIHISRGAQSRLLEVGGPARPCLRSVLLPQRQLLLPHVRRKVLAGERGGATEGERIGADVPPQRYSGQAVDQPGGSPSNHSIQVASPVRGRPRRDQPFAARCVTRFCC